MPVSRSSILVRKELATEQHGSFEPICAPDEIPRRRKGRHFEDIGTSLPALCIVEKRPVSMHLHCPRRGIVGDTYTS